MKRRRRSYGPVILLLIVALVIGFFLMSRYQEHSGIGDNQGASQEKQPTQEIKKVEIEVLPYNDSSLIMKINNYDGHSVLTLSDTFSNSNNYAQILNPNINFQKGLDNYPFSEGSNKKISGDYLVNFPIFWVEKVPYAILSKDFGVSESVFLFQKYENENATVEYHLDFSKLNMSVFNSIAGSGKTFILNEYDLFNSYFIFGDINNRCSKAYKSFSLNIKVSPDFRWNDSYCSQVIKLFDYYYDNFGKPLKLKSNYTITFSSADDFNAMSSGMMIKFFDLSLISHQLFHLWQPPGGDCIRYIFYREGLTAYMQYYSIFASGMQSREFVDNVFSRFFSDLSELKGIKKLYFLNQAGLIALRRNDSRAYDILIYEKGALIWKRIADSGVSVNDLFSDSLQIEGCDKITGLMDKYEKELYSEIISNDTSTPKNS